METKFLLVLAPTNESLDMDFVLELKTMLKQTLTLLTMHLVLRGS